MIIITVIVIIIIIPARDAVAAVLRIRIEW